MKNQSKFNIFQISILEYLVNHPDGASVQKIARHLSASTPEVARSIPCNPTNLIHCFQDAEGKWYAAYTKEQLDKALRPHIIEDQIDQSIGNNITRKNKFSKINVSQDLDSDAKKAFDYITAGESVFITGKAGTGKTFLLKHIVKALRGEKLLAVLAPTGVAAENAGGFTMHSFLRLPLTPYFPNYKKRDLYQIDVSTVEVLKQLDMIIIDEISMVRCDMLDAADNILRHYRKNDLPFGGVQLVMFGDIFQLMPVANEDDWAVLQEYYQSPYFFCSKVLGELHYRVVELSQNHRQETDKPFIELLNHIREAKITKKDVSFLNTRYFKDCSAPDEVVRLMTHNYKAKRYNQNKLDGISGELHTYKAKYNDWYEKFPADLRLELKEGARVMFIRNDNDGNFVNGSMGWVQECEYDYILVKKDDGRVIKVRKARWERYEYEVDKKNKTIVSYVAGDFTQFPLKLAWAVTIHKSQGLTFDNVVIDAERAFTYGQIYVALSRCRTFEGVLLLSRIYSQTIVADKMVKAYMEAIDKDGFVATLEIEDTEYEENALVLWISAKRLERIRSGQEKKFIHRVDEECLAREIYVTDDDGNFVINDIYKDRRRKWEYNDLNNGNFPFVVRKYREVCFTSQFGGGPVTREIIGDIQIGLDSCKCCWQLTIRLGNEIY